MLDSSNRYCTTGCAFGATYFHNDITNLIEGTTNPTTFVSTYVNVGQATT